MRLFERVPVGNGDPGKTSGVQFGETADFPGRLLDPGEVNGIGLGIDNAGVAEPGGDGLDIGIDRGEPGRLQRLAISLQNFVLAFVFPKACCGISPGLDQQSFDGFGFGVDLAVAGQFENRRVECQALAALLGFPDEFP